MKTGIALLFFAGLLAPANGRQVSTTSDDLAGSIGLDIGQQVPAFVLTDQFGHQQSNDALKGSKGTVLLFFRSADW